ncbi:Las17-binding protein actin regulator [Albimonas donghaensis]|uniref:Las17-binding protein actin regulator n=1 Tax=Albimonas donghaensis TaxID=356660 RepID=A0A1H3EXG6_9RHOB|nr:YSC84-related protein [Albimonas donghaensis]SDX83502.1 Las17-binding protein actin regulator [Albimonas donghaensis]
MSILSKPKSSEPARPASKPGRAAPRATRRGALAAFCAAAIMAVGACAMPGHVAAAEDSEVIDLRVTHAEKRMMANVSGARELMSRAKGVLIIPGITKAGLLIGGAYGEGSLKIGEATVGYYSMAAGSFGFQAGVQKFDQALFFMTTGALEKFRRSSGWEMGADAEVVTIDDGMAASLKTTTSQAPVISVVFGQEGLMAGVTLGGAKYTKLKEE